MFKAKLALLAAAPLLAVLGVRAVDNGAYVPMIPFGGLGVMILGLLLISSGISVRGREDVFYEKAHLSGGGVHQTIGQGIILPRSDPVKNDKETVEVSAARSRRAEPSISTQARVGRLGVVLVLAGAVTIAFSLALQII